MFLSSESAGNGGPTLRLRIVQSFLITLVLLCFTVVAQAGDDDLPAFPGAEGYGAFTKGGRGGKVLYVTTLEDYDPAKGDAPIPGSFRQAIDAKGPRNILFRVSGTIYLKAELVVHQPFLTIAGQTAPGDGICIAKYLFRIETHDVIIRYLRFRLGDLTHSESGTFQVGKGQDIIIDHCSISWSTDENCTLHAPDARNLTLQWSLISESLNRSFHPKGEHGHGSLLRSAEGGFSIHHTIYAHNNARNPRPGGYPDKPGLLLDFRNNIVYDWGEISGYSGLERTRLNYAGNYFKPGPSTAEGVHDYGFSARTYHTKLYLDDNFFFGLPEKTANNWMIVRKWGDYDGTVQSTNIVSEPFPAPPITQDHPEVAFEKILAGVGATLPKRDPIDARVVEEVRTGKGHIIDSQKDVGSWPDLKQGPVPVDSDNDGMPDEWEKQHGFNPNDPSDAAQDADGDGYTNLEEYLNGTDPRVSNRPKPGVDFDAVLARLAASNKASRAEIAAEVRARPPGSGFEGSAPIPVRKMEVRPATDNKKAFIVVINKDLQLQMNPIPAGTFMMGSPEDEPERLADETQHQVTISKPFYMGTTLITSEQYHAVTGGNSSHSRNDALPAEVDWPDAVRFCEALSRNTGHTFRLPTEAEWEYCCRAGTTTPFNTGATISTDQANYDGKFVYPGGQPGKYRRGPTPVGSFAPNAWGLYDMHGNAFEWCSDWYGPYARGAVIDPPGAPDGSDRVIRGGKYGSGPRYLRSASRYSYNPKNSSVVFGFRIVMNADKTK